MGSEMRMSRKLQEVHGFTEMQADHIARVIVKFGSAGDNLTDAVWGWSEGHDSNLEVTKQLLIWLRDQTDSLMRFISYVQELEDAKEATQEGSQEGEEGRTYEKENPKGYQKDGVLGLPNS